ncbi:MAG: hypothetical protein ACOX0U_05480 [Oscillospiraceae bacterium]
MGSCWLLDHCEIVCDESNDLWPRRWLMERAFAKPRLFRCLLAEETKQAGCFPPRRHRQSERLCFAVIGRMAQPCGYIFLIEEKEKKE